MKRKRRSGEKGKGCRRKKNRWRRGKMERSPRGSDEEKEGMTRA